MKRFLAAAAVATALVGATAAPAMAANDTSVEKCGNAIDMQNMWSLSAGGGPKAGIDAPTNCDQFYQFIGVIGSGN